MEYRCFFLNKDRYVLNAAATECLDDAAARRWVERLAREFKQPATIELWGQARLVGRYDHRSHVGA